MLVTIQTVSDSLQYIKSQISAQELGVRFLHIIYLILPTRSYKLNFIARYPRLHSLLFLSKFLSAIEHHTHLLFTIIRLVIGFV